MIERLLTFDEVIEQTEAYTRNLLLGNGFSMAYDNSRFSFTNLLDSAVKNKIIEKNSATHKLFENFGTSDFEYIIKLLESSANVLSIYNNEFNHICKQLTIDAQSLKNYLVDIVTNNHPQDATKIIDDEYINCINFLKRFDRIFTLNYDLLLFWSLMKYGELESQGKYLGDTTCRLKIGDGFGNSIAGTSDEYVIFKNNNSTFYQTIHYLHGALHIFDKQDEIIKNTYSRTQKTLREQTLENLNKSIYPIFISEGTANQKKAKIIHNSYLNNSFKTLRTLDKNDKRFQKNNALIIFGTMLKSNDDHIVEAILESQIQNVYIGIGSLEKKSELSYLETKLFENKRKLHFYDYKTLKVWR